MKAEVSGSPAAISLIYCTVSHMMRGAEEPPPRGAIGKNMIRVACAPEGLTTEKRERVIGSELD